MLTRLIQYVLRSITTLAVLALGGVVAAPAFASTAANVASKRPVPRGDNEVPLSGRITPALAAEQARVIKSDAQDFWLAKQTRAEEPQPITASVPVPAGSAVVHDGGAAPVKTPPATPVKDAPITAPIKKVEAKPIKTVKDTVKAVAKPVVKPIVNAGKVAAVLAFARAQLGERYVMGGAGPSTWDCSGLTMQAFASVGINIGGHGVNVQYQKARANGYLVPWSQRKPGDLVFYGTPGAFSHVAIYSGGGKIIEAANPARPVIERPYWGTPYGQVARFIR